MAEKDSKDSDSEKKLKSKRYKYLYILILLATISIVLSAVLLYKLHPSPIPDNIRKSAKFTIYYPVGIPINKNSIGLSRDGALLTYSVNYAQSKIYVSIQDKPIYFDFDNFDKGIKQPTTIQSAYGKATIGVLGGRMVGDLPAIDSWVLLSADVNTKPSSIAYVIQHLKKD